MLLSGSDYSCCVLFLSVFLFCFMIDVCVLLDVILICEKEWFHSKCIVMKNNEELNKRLHQFLY